MDTKWKNNLKLAGIVLLFTVGLHGLLSGLSNGHYYIGKGYFDSGAIESQYTEFIRRMAGYELNPVTRENVLKQIVVTKEEIEEHRFRYGNMQEQLSSIRGQYEESIRVAEADGDEELVQDLKAERDAKLSDIRENFRSDEHIRQKIVREKEARVNRYFDEWQSERAQNLDYQAKFKYYLKDVQSGEVFTNAAVNREQSIPNNMLHVKRYPGGAGEHLTIQVSSGNSWGWGIDEVQRAFAVMPTRYFEGWIAIPNTADTVNGYREFKMMQIFLISAMVAGAAALAAAIYLGRRSALPLLASMDQWRSYYNRIPIDLRLFLLFITGVITLEMLTQNNMYHYKQIVNDPFYVVKQILTHVLLMTAFLLAFVLQLSYSIRSVKEWNAERLREQWNDSIIKRVYCGAAAAFRKPSVGFQVFILLGLAFIGGIGLVVSAMQQEVIIVYLFAALITGVPALIMIFRRAGYFNRIVEAADAFAKGEPHTDLPVKGRTVLASLADNLNRMKHGVVSSQMKEAKSERLKTELITNVSHDLRTPLTSIISYTELLKKPELTEEERSGYIDIIDRKSQRLKVLIEDLFEASKMASGNAELHRSRVNLVQLMKQALAESEERIEASGLQFRVKLPEQPVYAIVDGQKLWRVFDNLVSNMLRYSLEQTRVYISMSVVGRQAEISFKNVAKFELGDNVDELFERFKRGDSSRHTEGSGLGLAIAKSIVDLHGGSLELDVDGDLFKVTLRLETDSPR